MMFPAIIEKPHNLSDRTCRKGEFDSQRLISSPRQACMCKPIGAEN